MPLKVVGTDSRGRADCFRVKEINSCVSSAYKIMILGGIL